jgi:hypothetical protein
MCGAGLDGRHLLKLRVVPIWLAREGIAALSDYYSRT